MATSKNFSTYDYALNNHKVGLLPSKIFFFICFNDSPSKMMKNAHFILKALFVLKIFKFLS